MFRKCLTETSLMGSPDPKVVHRIPKSTFSTSWLVWALKNSGFDMYIDRKSGLTQPSGDTKPTSLGVPSFSLPRCHHQMGSISRVLSMMDTRIMYPPPSTVVAEAVAGYMMNFPPIAKASRNICVLPAST